MLETEKMNFASRHIGPRPEDIEQMLETLGYTSMEDFIEDVVPADIRLSSPLSLDIDGKNRYPNKDFQNMRCLML